jgi:histidinol-phosphate aminotransferase
MRWVRRVLSPYSVNSLALACLPPALEDAHISTGMSAKCLRRAQNLKLALDA